MATQRDSMGNRWWADMYTRYGQGTDPSNVNYGHFNHSGLNLPFFTYAGDKFAVQLTSYCNGSCAYNVGGVDERVINTGKWRRIDNCSDKTGAPFICADGYLGGRRPTSTLYRNLN